MKQGDNLLFFLTQGAGGIYHINQQFRFFQSGADNIGQKLIEFTFRIVVTGSINKD
jgi:hypothetical protein